MTGNSEPEADRDQRRQDQNKQNCASQARKNFCTGALEKAKRHPESTFIAFSFSAELAMQSAVCGPDVGDPAVASMLKREIEGLVRRLKGGRDPSSAGLRLKFEDAEEIVHLLQSKGLLAPTVVESALEALKGIVISSCFCCC